MTEIGKYFAIHYIFDGNRYFKFFNSKLPKSLENDTDNINILFGISMMLCPIVVRGMLKILAIIMFLISCLALQDCRTLPSMKSRIKTAFVYITRKMLLNVRQSLGQRLKVGL